MQQKRERKGKWVTVTGNEEEEKYNMEDKNSFPEGIKGFSVDSESSSYIIGNKEEISNNIVDNYLCQELERFLKNLNICRSSIINFRYNVHLHILGI